MMSVCKKKIMKYICNVSHSSCDEISRWNSSLCKTRTPHNQYYSRCCSGIPGGWGWGWGRWWGWWWCWGIKPISSVPLFSHFRVINILLSMEHHVHIWQVSPQLSCGDNCLIWMWFEESSMYYCKMENFPNGEINEPSFSNPHRDEDCILEFIPLENIPLWWLNIMCLPFNEYRQCHLSVNHSRLLSTNCGDT